MKIIQYPSDHKSQSTDPSLRTPDPGSQSPDPGLWTSDSGPLPLPQLATDPLVSVLIANYNYEQYIGEALESLLGQRYENWEAIVCDDGSTDDSCRVVEGYASRDGRIKLIRQKNGGVGAALNTAYSACRGQVVCLLDADDYFEPAKISAVVEKMHATPAVGFVQHAMYMVGADGRRIKRLPRVGAFEEGWIAEQIVRRGGRWRNMPASALSLRRELADILFPMPAESLRSMADAYLYMLAPLIAEVGFVDQPLSGYRLHGDNLTGSLQLNPTTTEHYVEGLSRVFSSVSAKRKQAITQFPTIDSSHHLTYQEHRFMQKLFNEEGIGSLYRPAIELIRRIQRDDLYVTARKALGIVTFAIAPLWPRSLRPAWINWMLGERGVKRFRQ